MAVTQALSVTEVSTDAVRNTSQVRILWRSTQSGDSWNGYTRTAKYYVSINGGAETEYSVSYTLPQDSTKTIVDTTITVTHKKDGSGTVRVRTWMDTSISAGVVEKSQTLTLTTIPRSAALDAIFLENEYFNGKITYWYTPKSKSHYVRLYISLWHGSGSTLSSTLIKTINLGSGYDYKLTRTVTFSEDELSIIYNKLPNDTQGTLFFDLQTYSDSAYTVQVSLGEAATRTLTIPENASTKPNISMTLSPVTPYASLSSVYLQARSKVKATFSGSGKYGASIVSYSMKIGTKSYSSPYTSDTLGSWGDITVTGIATDSRGFTNTVTQTIKVLEYDKPSIIPYGDAKQIICKRCKEGGTPDDSGTYLLIQMGRKYSKVVSGGVQKNFCTLSYSYKTDAQSISSYSEPKEILKGSASSDYISTIIPNVVTSNTTAYNIQLIAEDTAGEKDIVTITVPSSFVTAHAPEGGHGITFGGYHDPSKVDVFDCKFDAEFHGSVRGSVYGLKGSSGNIPSKGDLNDYRVPGVYAVNKDADAEQIANMPPLVRYAGLLKVYASIGQDDVNEGTWKYITQEYRSRIPSTPEYRRRLWTDDTGTWQYSAWVSGIDDVVHLAGDATKVVAYTYKESDVEICQIAIYQGESYHFLQLTPTGIKYGKDGKVIWTK